MKILIVLITAITVALALSKHKVPLYAIDDPSAIEGEYIVVFKKKATDNEVASHMAFLRAHLTSHSKPDFEMKVTSEWKLDHFFRGYAATMNENVLDTVRGMSEVDYVEADRKVNPLKAQCIRQDLDCELWGLERTTTMFWFFPRRSVYSYSDEQAGKGIEVFIVDSGVDYNHPDFGGRIDRAKSRDYFDPQGDGMDYLGHGTHCAGTILSKTYGLAKKATGIAVRVADAKGNTTTEIVISGIEYAGNTGTPNKSVINLSLGLPLSKPLNDAVNGALAKGIHFSVAAGNEFGNACLSAPADNPNVVTVAATDSGDYRAVFSNTGPCVDIFAPGVGVLSTYLHNRTALKSGTSMAAPHVAGIMAKILSKDGAMTPAAMKARLINTASSFLQAIPSDTPNRMVFDGCK